MTGLLAAAGRGQLQAQVVGVGTLILFGFFASWLCVGPLAVLFSLLRPRQLIITPQATTVSTTALPAPDVVATPAQD